MFLTKAGGRTSGTLVKRNVAKESWEGKLEETILVNWLGKKQHCWEVAPMLEEVP